LGKGKLSGNYDNIKMNLRVKKHGSNAKNQILVPDTMVLTPKIKI